MGVAMSRSVLGAVALAATLMGSSIDAHAQGQVFRSTDSLFDFSRRAVVFTEGSLFREYVEVLGLDLEQAERDSWLPFGMISLSDRPREPSVFDFKYSLVVLTPLEFQGTSFVDQMTIQGHLFEVSGAYQTRFSLGDGVLRDIPLQLGGGANVLYSRISSNLVPDVSEPFDSDGELEPYVYGGEVVGTVHAFARLGSFLRWQSRLFFHSRSAADPRNISLDGRGGLVFPTRDDRGGLDFALFDQFEILGIGLAGEVQHGPSLWNFNEMLMAGLRERILIRDWGLRLDLGVKGFDGFTTNLVELNVGYISLPEMNGAITGGGRLGFDGRFYSARLSLALEMFKGEATVQIVNRRGEEDLLFGFGLGVTLGGIRDALDERGTRDREAYLFDAELAVYYNYLDHLDQVPAMRDTLFIMGKLRFDAGPQTQ